MDATERLEDEEACVVNEVVQASGEKEVIAQDCFAFGQFGLGSVEIEVDVETFEELCDGVLVGVRLLLDYTDQILEKGGRLITKTSYKSSR